MVECVLILCGKVWNVGTLLLAIENFVMGENEVAISKLFVNLVQLNKANNVKVYFTIEVEVANRKRWRID